MGIYRRDVATAEEAEELEAQALPLGDTHPRFSVQVIPKPPRFPKARAPGGYTVEVSIEGLHSDRVREECMRVWDADAGGE
jgi:hypothetical protein